MAAAAPFAADPRRPPPRPAWPAEGAREQADDPKDLDARIALAEQRLIAREEAVARGIHHLTDRLQQRMRPRRLLAPVLGVAAGVAVLWAVWRAKAPATPAASVAGAAARDGQPPRREMPWAQVLGFAWPLVPERLRARVNPTVVHTVVSIGLPMAQQLLRRETPAPLPTMPQVDLARYAGTWHEVARLPAPFEAVCEGQPLAHYAPRPDGHLAVRNRCVRFDGQWTDSDGEARPVPGSGGGRLEVSLWPEALRWLPFAWADYWILHVDDDYTEALVGEPRRRFLWLLSREPVLPPSRVQALVDRAAQLGFAVEKLHFNAPG